MRKRNILALGVFVMFYVALGVYLTLNQEKVAYHPFSQDFESCASFVGVEKVAYQGTRMYVKNLGGKPTVVLYHGNAGSACDRYFYADMFSKIGYGYIIVEYAGYSNDERKPSHELVKQDVEHVVSYLEESEPSSVFVVGESIGTGAAAYHTSLSSPEKLLLISPFTDLKDIARNNFWFYPTSIMVHNAFDNVTALKSYTGNTMVIHGTADNIIPHKLGEKLFLSLSGDTEMISIEGAGHNDLFAYEETYTKINEFLKETP